MAACELVKTSRLSLWDWGGDIVMLNVSGESAGKMSAGRLCGRLVERSGAGDGARGVRGFM